MIIAISGKIGSGKDTVTKIIEFLTAQSPTTIETNWETCVHWCKQYIETEEADIDSKWQHKKFASKLKEILAILTGIPDFAEKWDTNRGWRDVPLGEEWKYMRVVHGDPNGYRWTQLYVEGTSFHDLSNVLTIEHCQYTPRTLMTAVGTGALRNTVHPNIHINALFAEYRNTYENNPAYDNLGIYDVTEEFELVNPPMFPNWIISDLRFPNEYEAVKQRGGFAIRIERDKRCDECKETKAEQRGKVCGWITCPQGRPEHESETALDKASFKYTINNNFSMEELIETVRIILQVENIL